MTPPVLLDNTVLTNFALVGRADLATDSWGAATSTTPPAIAEYQVGVAGGLLPPQAWTHLPILTLTEKEVAFAGNLPLHLGAGERACLAVAFCRQGLLVSDDRGARRIAQQHGVPITGTIGILVLCVERGALSRAQADALLGEMQAAGYHAPVVSLAPLLDSNIT